MRRPVSTAWSQRASRRRRGPVMMVGALLAVSGLAACGDDELSTPPADAVSVGPTTTMASPNDPPVAIGGAPGTDGHRAVRLNPRAWEEIVARYVEDDPEDPYHEIATDGHDDFWFGIELHPLVGPGWTGELGLFATDCTGAGICVRFDPDGGAGPIGPIVSEPDGEVSIERIERGYILVLRHLVFVRGDGVSYRVDEVVIDTT